MKTKKTITLSLLEDVIENLDDVCDVLDTTREQLLTSLIEREFEARRAMREADCPWRITKAATEHCATICRCSLEDARKILEAAAIDAYLAERENRRQPKQLDSGALSYRGPAPRRLVLTVSRESPPAVIHVSAPALERRR